MRQVYLVQNLPTPSVRHPSNDIIQAITHENCVKFDNKVWDAESWREWSKGVLVNILGMVNVVEKWSWPELPIYMIRCASR